MQGDGPRSASLRKLSGAALGFAAHYARNVIPRPPLAPGGEMLARSRP
jgi:hypothetical protein